MNTLQHEEPRSSDPLLRATLNVSYFMKAAGHPPGEEATKLYARLCMEEDMEFVDAWTRLQMVGFEEVPEDIRKLKADLIDACFDSIWTKIGMLLAMGVNPSAVWLEGARSNHAKIVDGILQRRADGKVLKPEGWQPPNFEQLLP